MDYNAKEFCTCYPRDGGTIYVNMNVINTNFLRQG